MKVPADAKVFINDRATSSTGSEREYVSRDLQVGARYNYDVRVEFVVDGQPVTETKTVQLAAGQTGNVDFTQATAAVQTAAQSDARTTLIVRVPDDAKLYLSGHETQATGPVREFSTTKLPAGSEWSTYQIRAVVERDVDSRSRPREVRVIEQLVGTTDRSETYAGAFADGADLVSRAASEDTRELRDQPRPRFRPLELHHVF